MRSIAQTIVINLGFGLMPGSNVITPQSPKPWMLKLGLQQPQILKALNPGC